MERSTHVVSFQWHAGVECCLVAAKLEGARQPSTRLPQSTSVVRTDWPPHAPTCVVRAPLCGFANFLLTEQRQSRVVSTPSAFLTQPRSSPLLSLSSNKLLLPKRHPVELFDAHADSSLRAVTLH
eukprot:886652-Pleurochrysis_carterae.AAC.1